MTTLFDIGDKISFRLTGEIVEYTKSKNGDCYRIKVESDNDATNGLWVFLESEALLAANATLVK